MFLWISSEWKQTIKVNVDFIEVHVLFARPMCVLVGSRIMSEWREGLVDWTKHHSQPNLDISPVWTPLSQQKWEGGGTATPSSVDWVGNFVFLLLLPYRKCISPLMISILIVLWCWASYVCSFFNVLMFRLNSCRWFVLCLACTCIPYQVLVHVSRDREYLCRLDPTEQVLPEDGYRIRSPRCVLKYECK
jgi:hypothetical protein